MPQDSPTGVAEEDTIVEEVSSPSKEAPITPKVSRRPTARSQSVTKASKKKKGIGAHFARVYLLVDCLCLYL